MNSLTPGVTISPKIPITMPNDCYTVQATIKLSKQIDPKTVKLVRIANMMELEKIQIAESLMEEASEHNNIEIIGVSGPMIFDNQGNYFNV